MGAIVSLSESFVVGDEEGEKLERCLVSEPSRVEVASVCGVMVVFAGGADNRVVLKCLFPAIDGGTNDEEDTRIL